MTDQSKHDQMLALVEPLRNGQQCDEDGVMCIISRQLCHEAADALTTLLEENERLRDGIYSIQQYSSDTISGPSKQSDDTRDWQRQAVLEVHKRCCLLLSGHHWDASEYLKGDTT